VITSSYSQLIDRLAAAKNILLITHISPDGDALGSLGFMSEWLSVLHKNYTSYTAGPLPSTLSFLPNYHEFITDKEKIKVEEYDVIISLDCGSVARTNIATEIKNRRPDQFFIEIDHHPAIEKASDLEIREPTAAATAEILYKISQTAHLPLTPRMSHCLLTGILTDTGNFSFSVTSEHTIAAAAQMLLQGASLPKIIDRTWRTKKLPDLKLWGLALSRLKLLPRYGVTYTHISSTDLKETQSDHEALEGLPEFISALPDTQAIMVLFDDEKGMIHGNLRTTQNNIDVGALARRLGGGGHRKAAGFSLTGKLIKSNNGWRVET
jgi:phosphoesterase RecJ-like protein